MKKFEMSKADKEPKGMKEGSRKEEKLDAKQMKAVAGPKGFAAKVGMKCGGPVKKMASGGKVKSGRGC